MSTWPEAVAPNPLAAGAAGKARGQGSKPPRTPSQAAQSTRPLTARCGCQNEKSGGAMGSTEAARSAADALGRDKPRRDGTLRGRPPPDANGMSEPPNEKRRALLGRSGSLP